MDTELLQRYIAGDVTEAERKQVLEWIDESPEHLREYMAQRKLYDIRLWRTESEAEEEVKAVRGGKRLVVEILKLVAVFVLAFGCSYYWWDKKTTFDNYQSVFVPAGQRAELKLADGTKIWLNSQTRLIYPSSFGKDVRSVKLDGEAYFEVAHDADVPFEVHTKEVNVTVLGTKFNFRNYAEDMSATVDLEEGRVKVLNAQKADDAGIYLRPDERVIFDKETGTMSKVQSKFENANAWINNELLFDELQLNVIAKRLARSFDVQVEVADSIGDKRFYGSFAIQGNTIEEVLNVMASTNQMRYKYENGKYIIY